MRAEDLKKGDSVVKVTGEIYTVENPDDDGMVKLTDARGEPAWAVAMTLTKLGAS